MHKHDHTSSSHNLKTAFFLNLTFTVIEIIGGILTNSISILSDALHDLGDSIALGLSWFLQNYSGKKPDYKFSFGYARFSMLGALINSIILIIGSIIILTRAIPRIINPEPVIPQGMLVLAVLGIIINGAAALKLTKGSSLNEKTVSWHLLEDVLGWAAVLIVSITMLIWDIPILDPILSLLITLFVLLNITKNLIEIFRVLLQSVPRGLSISELESEIISNTGVESVHHTHIWTLDGEKNMFSTHAVVKDDISREEIIEVKKNIKQLMLANGISHITVEIEFKNEQCPDKQC